MLLLPILNVRLNRCHEDWQQMTPVAQGHHCAQCDRVVIDFTTSTQTDLTAAFQSSPDGRVCGRFRSEQVTAHPLLRLKLRRFLVALVLVCGLGLSGQEALAQVRKTLPPAALQPKTIVHGSVAEKMPVYKDGGQEGIMLVISKNLQYPIGLTRGGRVVVGFTVDTKGKVCNPHIVKGLGHVADEAALHAVKTLGDFTPGLQNGQPVEIPYTIPITFQATDASAPFRKRK
ncbi:energy transducer TonB [Hymenobacter mucosus]|uniref:Protein TonB n=1 Tax=Hymenobacter mucosus TaxID=1411120 RepID=A0A238X013_9BACT|nr:energy transducer TonB [Hymenobacter mucosus]SNR52255.1 protein TonB [Hymenobacter mucosus]